MRAPTATWYWVFAGWPAFAAIALFLFFNLFPHRDIVGVADTILHWFFRLMLATSLALIVVFPRALERVRESHRPNATPLKIAFGFLCVSTAFQGLFELWTFLPHF